MIDYRYIYNWVDLHCSLKHHEILRNELMNALEKQANPKYKQYKSINNKVDILQNLVNKSRDLLNTKTDNFKTQKHNQSDQTLDFLKELKKISQTLKP